MPRGYSIRLRKLREAIAEHLRETRDTGVTAKFFGCSINHVEACAYESGMELPTRQILVDKGLKIVYYLLYESKLTFQEIADIVGVSANCVMHWQRHARKAGFSLRQRKRGPVPRKKK